MRLGATRNVDEKLLTQCVPEQRTVNQGIFSPNSERPSDKAPRTASAPLSAASQ